MPEARENDREKAPRKHQGPLTISVIIPVPPEMETPAVLDGLRSVDYPRERIEVLVVRGRRPALQRNEAAKVAKGDILFFLDDDSTADVDLFKKNVSFYENPQVAGVGGPALPLAPETTVQAATDIVLASIFGDFRGCMRFASRGEARRVAEDEVILCNLSLRREAFLEADGFHDALYPNEENALLQKILSRHDNRVFMYAPDAVIRRPRPRTVGEFWRKVFGYGMGRLEQTLLQPSPICFLRLSAVLFPLYWLALPLLFFANPWALLPGALYFAGNAVMTAKVYATVRSLGVSLAAFVLFPVMHMAYPAGIIWAATVRRIFGRRVGDEAVEVVRVKSFDEP